MLWYIAMSGVIMILLLTVLVLSTATHDTSDESAFLTMKLMIDLDETRNYLASPSDGLHHGMMLISAGHRWHTNLQVPLPVLCSSILALRLIIHVGEYLCRDAA